MAESKNKRTVKKFIKKKATQKSVVSKKNVTVKKTVKKVATKPLKRTAKKVVKKVPSKIVKTSKKIVKKKVVKKVAKKTTTPKKKPVKKVVKKVSGNQTIDRPGTQLKRFINNPILEPRPYSWESKATFNPAAFILKGHVHLVYRAIGEDDSSYLGYALSKDGFSIDERPPYAFYQRSDSLIKANFEVDPIWYVSGGSWNGGCEDPRVTVIGDTLYMLYTAFDGWGSLRLALTSTKVADFENKKPKWKKPSLISPPGQIHKNWVIFPEKIGGKFGILHSVYPKILVEYFDNLSELNGKRFIHSNNTRPIDKSRTWDSWFRGIGPTPIKTDMGWLMIYHAMDHNNPDRYRMGAMILDIKDPTKILYRSAYPILEPEEDYENNGHKWGVVYCCGAVVKDGELLVYYGGADKVIGVASVLLKELLDDLKTNKVVQLKKLVI